MHLAALAFRWLAPRDGAAEPLELDDGRAVVVRPITPDAKPVIAEAISHVSPESSRRRFLTVRRRFSERELDELTNMDGWNRYALGACETGPRGTAGAAVARFARLPDDPRAAELALLVVDAWQGVGLGRALLDRLFDAARARGVERFTGIVLRDNAPMITMLRHHAPGLSLVDAGDHLAIDVPLMRPGLLPALAGSVVARLAALASARQRESAAGRA